MLLDLFISGIGLFICFDMVICLHWMLCKELYLSVWATLLWVALIICGGGAAFILFVFRFAKAFNLLP